ncbi:hypothetical protein GOODEAATRI_015937 [Goodea atripinnis]|uniref:Uncharacterized protein n=1 Tax=Goodea atripinnis TaxID=208336 RepID=A0ABV0NW83_9TELE
MSHKHNLLRSYHMTHDCSFGSFEQDVNTGFLTDIFITVMKMAYWHPLLPTELREDEALQKKLEEETADRTMQETLSSLCPPPHGQWKKLEQERDEAMEKLTEFQLGKFSFPLISMFTTRQV